MSTKPTCGLCGDPMPEGEEMFKYHGYSGPCPKSPKPSTDPDVEDDKDYVAWCRYTENGSIVTCDSDAPKAFKVYRHEHVRKP